MCINGHVLKKEDLYHCNKCMRDDKHTRNQYYPDTAWNRYYGLDTVRKESILNNENGNFQVLPENKEDEINEITDRKQAVVAIAKKAFNHKAEKIRHVEPAKGGIVNYIGGIFSSKEEYFYEDAIINKQILQEGNNITVLSKLFKNVYIRWDKWFKFATRQCFELKNDASGLIETREEHPV